MPLRHTRGPGERERRRSVIRSCIVSPCGRGRGLSPPRRMVRMPRMQELAPDLWQLGGFPPHAINVYLIGGYLIDAATRWGGGRILRELGGRRPVDACLDSRPPRPPGLCPHDLPAVRHPAGVPCRGRADDAGRATRAAG